MAHVSDRCSKSRLRRWFHRLRSQVFESVNGAARNTCLLNLVGAVLGSSVTNSTYRGTPNFGSVLFAYAISSSGDRSQHHRARHHHDLDVVAAELTRHTDRRHLQHACDSQRCSPRFRTAETFSPRTRITSLTRAHEEKVAVLVQVAGVARVEPQVLPGSAIVASGSAVVAEHDRDTAPRSGSGSRRSARPGAARPVRRRSGPRTQGCTRPTLPCSGFCPRDKDRNVGLGGSVARAQRDPEARSGTRGSRQAMPADPPSDAQLRSGSVRRRGRLQEDSKNLADVVERGALATCALISGQKRGDAELLDEHHSRSGEQDWQRDHRLRGVVEQREEVVIDVVLGRAPGRARCSSRGCIVGRATARTPFDGPVVPEVFMIAETSAPLTSPGGSSEEALAMHAS